MSDVEAVEKLAGMLCLQDGQDPERLEPGNLAPMVGLYQDKFRNGEYDDLFDNGTYPPDGHNGKDKCMFAWRGYIWDAQEILAAIQADPLAYVKPKPLEWVESGLFKAFQSGIYLVQYEYDDKGKATWAFGINDTLISDHPTLEAAQAAAETHRNEMLAKEFE